MDIEKICSIENCNKILYTMGLCEKHYAQEWYKNNRDKIRNRCKQYYQKNKEKIKSKTNTNNRSTR